MVEVFFATFKNVLIFNKIKSYFIVITVLIEDSGRLVRIIIKMNKM